MFKRLVSAVGTFSPKSGAKSGESTPTATGKGDENPGKAATSAAADDDDIEVDDEDEYDEESDESSSDGDSKPGGRVPFDPMRAMMGLPQLSAREAAANATRLAPTTVVIPRTSKLTEPKLSSSPEKAKPSATSTVLEKKMPPREGANTEPREEKATTGSISTGSIVSPSKSSAVFSAAPPVVAPLKPTVVESATEDDGSGSDVNLESDTTTDDDDNKSNAGSVSKSTSPPGVPSSPPKSISLVKSEPQSPNVASENTESKSDSVASLPLLSSAKSQAVSASDAAPAHRMGPARTSDANSQVSSGSRPPTFKAPANGRVNRRIVKHEVVQSKLNGAKPFASLDDAKAASGGSQPRSILKRHGSSNSSSQPPPAVRRPPPKQLPPSTAASTQATSSPVPRDNEGSNTESKGEGAGSTSLQSPPRRALPRSDSDAVNSPPRTPQSRIARLMSPKKRGSSLRPREDSVGSTGSRKSPAITTHQLHAIEDLLNVISASGGTSASERKRKSVKKVRVKKKSVPRRRRSASEGKRLTRHGSNNSSNGGLPPGADRNAVMRDGQAFPLPGSAQASGPGRSLPIKWDIDDDTKLPPTGHPFEWDLDSRGTEGIDAFSPLAGPKPNSQQPTYLIPSLPKHHIPNYKSANPVLVGGERSGTPTQSVVTSAPVPSGAAPATVTSAFSNIPSSAASVASGIVAPVAVTVSSGAAATVASVPTDRSAPASTSSIELSPPSPQQHAQSNSSPRTYTAPGMTVNTSPRTLQNFPQYPMYMGAPTSVAPGPMYPRSHHRQPTSCGAVTLRAVAILQAVLAVIGSIVLPAIVVGKLFHTRNLTSPGAYECPNFYLGVCSGKGRRCVGHPHVSRVLNRFLPHTGCWVSPAEAVQLLAAP